MEILTLDERILLYRHRARLSKTELAERIGVSAATIANYENGVSVPNEEMRERLSIALGITINRLMFGFDDPAKDMPKEPLIKKRQGV